MSGLKGVKTMSMGNGSADCLQVSNLKIGTASLGSDMTLSNGKSLNTILSNYSDEIHKLKLELKELKDKLDSLETTD